MRAGGRELCPREKEQPMCRLRGKIDQWLPRTVGSGIRVTDNGHEVSFWGDEDVLEIYW